MFWLKFSKFFRIRNYQMIINMFRMTRVKKWHLYISKKNNQIKTYSCALKWIDQRGCKSWPWCPRRWEWWPCSQCTNTTTSDFHESTSWPAIVSPGTIVQTTQMGSRCCSCREAPRATLTSSIVRRQLCQCRPHPRIGWGLFSAALYLKRFWCI